MARAKRHSLKQNPDSRLYCRKIEEALPHFHSVLNLEDVIFMAIDFEGRPDVGNSNITQIGVSTLDTRQLAKGSGSISSRHICTRYRDKSFLFGESEYRGNTHLPALIESLFYIEDTDQSTPSSEPLGPKDEAVTSPKYRRIVLIGHGISNDLSLITEFQVEVQDILTIVDIVDTGTVGKALFEKGVKDRGSKLADLLELLGCPYGKLHNAGNDATFTLRAFLALALKSRWAGPQHWLSEFQRLSYAPVEVDDILKEKLAQRIANGRAAKLMRDQQKVGKERSSKSENTAPLDPDENELG